MSLITVAQLRQLVTTALNDTEVQAIIDREESVMIARLGAHGDGSTSTTLTLRQSHSSTLLFLPRRMVSVSQVRERAVGGDFTTLTTTQYEVAADEGYIMRVGQVWPAVIEVTYVPTDDRERRRQVLVELCRLTLEHTAMRSENTAGEYSYQAPDWEATRAQLYRRITFMPL